MFNIGIRVDADNFTTETQAVVSDLQQTLNRNGITVPVNLNNVTLKEMDQFIQSIGGSMKITKDAITGFIENISVNVPKANGQILSLNQGVQAVSNTVTNLNGVTQQVFSHFETTDITTTMNGMNTSLERVKELQSGIVSKVKERLSLEQQLADAIVNNDSKDQAALMQKINKAKYMENMQRDALSVLQQQSNALGQQVNYFETVNNQVSQAESSTARWVGQMIQTGQAALDLARNLGQSKETITQFFTLYQKVMSSNGTQHSMLAEDLQNMEPQINSVMKAMENLGATFDEAGAHYSGLNTGMQELVNLFNKLKRSTDEFNAKRQDQSDDTRMIEQTVQAYKDYRDQLDRINQLKKENATGVDMRAEQQQLNSLRATYKQLEQQILSNGEAVYKNTQYNRDKNQVTRDSIQAQKELNVTLQDNSLQSLIADTITYTVSLQSLQQVIQSIISETVSLNDSMTQIRLVTQGSSDDTKALMSDYSEIAKQLGTTTSAVAESATEWLRQGNTVEETGELVKASTTLSVIGAMDASDATTALTASLNGYNMEASDAMKIVDQLTTLDLKYATSSGDIANALSRVASSASAAGVPLERMEAIITVTADQTQQAAETIGRAWNSVIQRINKISAGKDVSDTGKSLNDVEKALKTVGIALRDDNGIIKASSDILDEVAAKWDTWNRNQQSQIATAIAGTNQANIFRATMNDYKEVLEATTIAENANGSATERMSIYTESLTAKINTFKTTWTELVNDLNLDSLIGLVVDLGTKLLEILNILLNKIPVLSDALKAVITVQGINILVGAVVKAIRKITGTEGIGGLLTGLINLKQAFQIIRGEATGVTVVTEGMSGAMKSFASAMSLASSVASFLGISLGALAGILGVVTVGVVAAVAAFKHFSIDGQIDRANKKLEESQEALDDTKAKIAELKAEKEELSGKPEERLTQSEKDRLETLNEQLETYEKIRQKKQQIVDEDEENANKLEAKKKDEKYSGDNTYSEQKSLFNYEADTLGIDSALEISDGENFATYLAQLENLKKIQKDILNGNNEYGLSIEDVNGKIGQLNDKLEDQAVDLREDKLWYETTNQTASDGYKEINTQLEAFSALKDSSEWEDSLISKVVDLDKLKKNLNNANKEVLQAQQDLADGVDGVTKNTVAEASIKAKESADKIMTDTVNSAAEAIMKNDGLKNAAELAFNIDLSTFDGYIRLKEILSEDIPKAFEEAKAAAEGANSVFATHSGYVEQYTADVTELAEKQKILNTAYSEMKEKGELTSATVKSLIEQAPELANAIEIQDGKMRINIETLQDLSNQYYDTKIADYQSQIDMTGITVEEATKRVQAYQEEMKALDKLMAKMKEKDQSEWTDNDWAQYKGMQRTQYEAGKEVADYMNVYNLQEEIDNLSKLKAGGLTYTPSNKNKGGGSGSKTDPEKEAYELKKSEIEVVQKQLELEKSKLEQQKKGLEQQKSALELDKSHIELQKQIKEQQLDIIEDAEDGIDDIIELIKKMTKQDYENLKTKLGEVKDYIGDFKDALDDVKDTYDDLVDDAKDKLKAEKEAADNQKKLEDGAKSIAEIQAQLAEIQYDDSADAQAKRLELTASLNEKQQDLEDEMKDQAYDAATDALDKTKDKVDNIFDAIGDILDASQDAIADYITYISDELESEGNLYQAAVAQFNDTSEGAQEELYNRLIDYNNKYGDSINKTVTEPWNEAIAAVERYKEVAGSADIDAVRQYLGSQDTQLNASIKLDEQTIDGLDNQIDQIKIDMDKVDQQVTQFEQAISQVKDALSQLEINYKAASNTSDSGEQGVGDTGTDYAYGLIKGLLQQAGVDTSALPATYQGFVDALSQTTEAATGTKDALVNLTDQVDETTPEVEGLGDTSTDAGSQIEISGEQADATVQPLTDVATSGEQAAGALSGVANAASGSSSGSGFGNLLTFLTGGDTDKFVQNFATKAISKYLPKLIKAGIGMIGKLHDGTDEVKKSNSWLDKRLGLGKDETARILKVGEAVIPDYANDAVQSMGSPAIRPTVTAPNTSNIKTTNNSELNIDMGDLDISGIDTTELRNELEGIKKESANQVYSTLYRYIKVGGYRNVRNRYN